jgi:2-methylcitrate dehydratase
VPVFAALELRPKVREAEIETLVIETFKQAFERWISLPEIWRPETRETADHSLPFCVAAALIDGEITPGTFDSERYRDPDILDLMGRSRIELNETFADLAPETRCCRITAALTNGRSIAVERRLGPADDLKGMSRTDLEAKFHGITRRYLDERARAALIDLVWHFDDLDSVGPLLDHSAVAVG